MFDTIMRDHITNVQSRLTCQGYTGSGVKVQLKSYWEQIRLTGESYNYYLSTSVISVSFESLMSVMCYKETGKGSTNVLKG